MSVYSSSVSPKGQITIPVEVRTLLGVKPKDRVAFIVDGEAVRISRLDVSLEDGHQSVAALAHLLTWREITEIAHEEHAAHVAREGLDDVDADR